MLNVTGLSYDPEPARQHIRELMACGIGFRQVADLAGVSRYVVGHLVFNYKRPILALRPEVTARILAVTPDGNHAPCALVDATAARRRLQALVANGWSVEALAGRLRMSRRNTSFVMTRARITAKTDRAVASLYNELWDVPPDESTPQARKTALRARLHAQRRGWPPPLAWDDDRIADPDAEPAKDWQRPAGQRWRSVDLAAEVEDLMASEGLTRQQAADRLGVTKDAIEKAFSRTKDHAEMTETAA